MKAVIQEIEPGTEKQENGRKEVFDQLKAQQAGRLFNMQPAKEKNWYFTYFSEVKTGEKYESYFHSSWLKKQ